MAKKKKQLSLTMIRDTMTHHFDDVIVTVVLLCTLILAAIGGYATYHFLIAEENTTLSLIPKTTSLRDANTQKALSILETRKQAAPPENLSTTRNPFPTE